MIACRRYMAHKKNVHLGMLVAMCLSSFQNIKSAALGDNACLL